MILIASVCDQLSHWTAARYNAIGSRESDVHFSPSSPLEDDDYHYHGDGDQSKARTGTDPIAQARAVRAARASVQARNRVTVLSLVKVASAGHGFGKTAAATSAIAIGKLQGIGGGCPFVRGTEATSGKEKGKGKDKQPDTAGNCGGVPLLPDTDSGSDSDGDSVSLGSAHPLSAAGAGRYYR